MLHIGDKSYYKEISDRMKAYDVVLYELITDTKNCVQSEDKDYKRQLTKEIYSKVGKLIDSYLSQPTPHPPSESSFSSLLIFSKDANNLASSFGLVTQVDDLYNTMATLRDNHQHHNNWYIADLDAAEIARLEAQRRSVTLSSFYNSRYAGRAWREQLIPSFQLTLPDTGVATLTINKLLNL
jgi:hypothetical protein